MKIRSTQYGGEGREGQARWASALGEVLQRTTRGNSAAQAPFACMRLHEVHPAIAHFPVALLPTAVLADAFGSISGDESWNDVGRKLMPLAVAGMGVTGLAGFVAQSGVNTGESSHDLMISHRNLNVGLLAGTAILAAARSRRRRPGLGYLIAGLAASAAVTYTGYLGGRMVYTHGVGVAPAGGVDRDRSPHLGRTSPGDLAREAAENTVHAAKHAGHHLAEGKVAPTLKG